MTLKEFREKHPEDLKTGALQEIRQRYAALAEAMQQGVPPATGRRGSKRAAEPVTVLRTVRARRTGSTVGMAHHMAPPPLPAASTRSTRGNVQHAEPDTLAAVPEAVPQEDLPAAHPAMPVMGSFNGRPLQTPMPFAGQAMALPVTMLTQKRGGRTKAAPVPDAAVVTTADGMQWALGKDGVAGIPESHRAEVAELLSAQFNFLAAALGRTVFDRQGGRGKR